MAAAWLSSQKKRGIEVKSAGLFAMDGQPISAHAAAVLAQQGIDSSHTSSSITREMLDWATHIFTMTSSHKQMLANQAPDTIDKLFTLKEFVGENGDVVDPYGGDLSVYQMTFEEMQQLINRAIKKLEN
ncbi:hypothetical protein A2U94_05875 [Bacillus sp. VT 712]|uniref:Phosphotyrosine protein phosphatase I domain-containing protein n=2 Tax=Bacillales TaxID=1385 RepID=A0A0V8JPF4_9BACI|nr:hypothetical protein AS180_05720 [Priestia veravalensis]KZB92415.1 hypothetical protein A2U94_05875 [Bacillus sp. VT 712]